MADPKPAPSPFFEAVDAATWRARVEANLGGRTFEDALVSRTPEGLRIEPLYADRREAPPSLPSPSRPGWELHAEYDAGDPVRAREELAADLRRGVRGVRLLHASGERSKAILEGVDLEQVAIHTGATGRAMENLDALLELARARGVDPAGLRGGVGADPIGTRARLGGELTLSKETRTELADLVRRASESAPGVTALAVRTTPYQRAGAGLAQQIAVALATGVEYLRWLTEEGVDLEIAAASIELELCLGTDFFLEIAKLRAMRLAWAKLIAAAGGSRDAQCVPIHARTSERCWSRRDPWVNLLRGTTVTMAAALGGADSIVTAPFDRAVGRPDELARRLAIDTQTILDEETRASIVRDPAAGSGYVETVTRELASSAWRAFRDLERVGGIRGALASGSLRGAIEVIASRERERIVRREHGLVGVSEFPDLDEAPLEREPLPADHELREGALAAGRLAEPFERLRDRSDAHLARCGARPKVFLANLGRLPEFRARATFAANLFAAGGLESIHTDGFSTAVEAAETFAASGAKLCAICSTDARYVEAVPELVPLLAERGAIVILAGPPGESERAWREAGVAYFIHIGCDALAVLETLLNQAAGVEG